MLKMGTYGFIRIALPDPARGRAEVRAVDRPAGRDRHRLRRARLPGPEGPEAADRVLLGRAHGLRDARHRHAHRLSGSTRRSSAWSPTASSPACSSSASARSTTATTRARSRGSAAACRRAAEAGRDLRLLRDRLARPARPRRLLGRGPGAAVRRSTRATALGLNVGLFRSFMVAGRHRHGADRRLLPVDAPAREHGHAAGQVAGTRLPRRPRRGVARPGCRCWSLIAGPRRFPRLIFGVTDGAGRPARAGLAAVFGGRSREPDVDYHAILPELILSGTIVLVLVVDAFLPGARVGLRCRSGLVGVLAALASALTLVGEAPLDLRRPLRGRQLHGRVPGASSWRSRRVVLALSLRYFREGGFYQGEYYFLLLTVVPRLRADAGLARPADAVHLARAGVGARVPDGGVPQVRPARQRRRAEVLPHRGAVDGGDALRHEPDLRAHRRHAPGRGGARASRTCPARR